MNLQEQNIVLGMIIQRNEHILMMQQSVSALKKENEELKEKLPKDGPAKEA